MRVNLEEAWKKIITETSNWNNFKSNFEHKMSRNFYKIDLILVIRRSNNIEQIRDFVR